MATVLVKRRKTGTKYAHVGGRFRNTDFRSGLGKVCRMETERADDFARNIFLAFGKYTRKKRISTDEHLFSKN